MDSSKEFQSMLDKAIESEPLAFKDFDRTKNVQDQLQEMVRRPHDLWFGAMLARFMVWYNKNQMALGSMEQLWLAFVMSELHRKEWDGEIWKVK